MPGPIRLGSLWEISHRPMSPSPMARARGRRDYVNQEELPRLSEADPHWPCGPPDERLRFLPPNEKGNPRAGQPNEILLHSHRPLGTMRPNGASIAASEGSPPLPNKRASSIRTTSPRLMRQTNNASPRRSVFRPRPSRSRRRRNDRRARKAPVDRAWREDPASPGHSARLDDRNSLFRTQNDAPPRTQRTMRLGGVKPSKCMRNSASMSHSKRSRFRRKFQTRTAVQIRAWFAL